MRPIRLRGARTNNLQGIDLDLEPGTFVVLCGPSGAGKSSLALGTLYAEGQRRYVESFSAYARQFLERLKRPPVDSLEPVPAAVAVDRSARVRTSRATVGTMSEICAYARVLWARAAVLHCPQCQRPVHAHDAERVADAVLARVPGTRIVVTFPMAVPPNGSGVAAEMGSALTSQGYHRVWVDGEVRELADLVAGSNTTEGLFSTVSAGPNTTEGLFSADTDQVGTDRVGTVDIIADRTVAKPGNRGRLVESIAAAMHRGRGRADIHVVPGTAPPMRFSNRLHCAHCDLDFRPAVPGLFSFDSPVGACPECRGFGRVIGIDIDKVMPDPELTLAGGAIRPWRSEKYDWERRALRVHAKRARVPLDVPVASLSATQRTWLMEGDGAELDGDGWFGLRKWFRWLESKNYKMHVRVLLARYRAYDPCPRCRGTRLVPEAGFWQIDGYDIAKFLALSVDEASEFIREQIAQHGQNDATHAARDDLDLLLNQCHQRLEALADVGLGYLSLDRAARTLSGGESQRVALTAALSASLAGALVVLDEPTSGLHPRDVDRLIAAMRRLTVGGSTAVVVDNDTAVIAAADRAIELGPGSGVDGGQVVFDGTPAALRRAATTTGKIMRSRTRITPERPPADAWIELQGARGHNLRAIDIRLPQHRITCVTGVSGSGKSTLISETLAPAVMRSMPRGKRQGDIAHPLPYDGLSGLDGIEACHVVDQSPLGRTQRGNAATYIGAWDWVRELYANMPLARRNGYGKLWFSFNGGNGRCQACKGEGAETVEMQFLADISFSCPACGGRRFSGPILQVTYRGKNIADILDMTVIEAYQFFPADDYFAIRMDALCHVGLSYLRLGQPLATLSGGEAQRLRLAKAIVEANPGSMLILDEPTAGLHGVEVMQLLDVFDRLIERQMTIVVIEHDMRVAAYADWVIELGPGAGRDGGSVVAMGPAPHVADAAQAASGPYLAAALAGSRPKTRQTTQQTTSAGGKRQSTSGQKRRTADNPATAAYTITIDGAREHNLTHVSVDIPREQLVVVTGPSGSGKSTLVFDVLYAEGQRRYLETLSPYARQYLPQLPRPDVDHMDGIPPTVALEQRIRGAGAGSTVATLSEVGHYLRLLYARAGVMHCPDCHLPIAAQTPGEIAATVQKRRFKAKPLVVLAPVVRGRKGNHRLLLRQAQANGIEWAMIDGEMTALEDSLQLDHRREHDIELVVGRIGKQHIKGGTFISDDTVHELTEYIADAAGRGEGSVRLMGAAEGWYSTKRACPSCGSGFPELDPRLFSANTRQGACPTCEGKGRLIETVGRGKQAREISQPCTSCDSTRLAPQARAVTVGNAPITHILCASVHEAEARLAALELDPRTAAIGSVPIAEARMRLAFLQRVGVGYLGLDREARTLSGGEVQRVRLAAQLGSGLTGILYVLDEPTIGLHPRDSDQLITAMRSLVDRGNSLVVVEHDSDTIRAADHIIDIGPGGGRHGGRVVAEGSVAAITADTQSITGRALIRPADIPQARRKPVAGRSLRLRGARMHNLAGIDVDIPLGCLVAVTGVSGSGKSTLVRHILFPALRRTLAEPAQATKATGGKTSSRKTTGRKTSSRKTPAAKKSARQQSADVSPATLPYRDLRGAEHIRRAAEIDQSPIGRTPRSVPATYIGIWDEIRKLLAATPEARARGFGPGRFSFNRDEGRCGTCAGQGTLTAEMAFLPDVHLPCEDCAGMRFASDTLEVTWRGLSAGDILRCEVTEAADIFAPVSKIARPLRLLCDLGLGYLQLGQASNTLSGGEAQRLKLVAELGSRSAGGTVYIMDEPTTGLHRDDVARLLTILHRLIDRGDTVIVIEHHPDIMVAADWVIDMGPEGGDEGGQIVACGAPETIAACSHSHTGKAIRHSLTDAP